MAVGVKVELIDRVVVVRWLRAPEREDVAFIQEAVAAAAKRLLDQPLHYIGLSGELGLLTDEQNKLVVEMNRNILPQVRSSGLVIEGNSLKQNLLRAGLRSMVVAAVLGQKVLGLKVADGLAEKIRFYDSLELALQAIRADLTLPPAEVSRLARERGLA